MKDVDSLSWMANNTQKLFPLQTGRPECWTFFSTAAYGKRNKVPQENIPKITAEKVKEDMLRGVELALGLSRGSLQQPFYTRVQLWYNNACLEPLVSVYHFIMCKHNHIMNSNA